MAIVVGPIKAVGEVVKATDYNTNRLALLQNESNIISLDSTGILNSNFEVDDGGGPAEPLNWTFDTPVAGGSHVLNTSTPLSGTQSLTLSTLVTTNSEVSMESDKVIGGHFAVDLSFAYRTTSAIPRFRVQLLEYNAGGSLVSTLDILDTDDTGGVHIAEDTIGMTLNGLVGNGIQYSLKFILGGAGETTAGSVEIDSIIVHTRPDIISKSKFKSVRGGGSFNYIDRGFIYIPSGTNTITSTMFIAVASGSGSSEATIDIDVATASSSSVTAGDFGVRDVAVTVSGLSLPGIFKYRVDANNNDMVTVETEFQDKHGFKAGLVYG